LLQNVDPQKTLRLNTAQTSRLYQREQNTNANNNWNVALKFSREILLQFVQHITHFTQPDFCTAVSLKIITRFIKI